MAMAAEALEILLFERGGGLRNTPYTKSDDSQGSKNVPLRMTQFLSGANGGYFATYGRVAFFNSG